MSRPAASLRSVALAVVVALLPPALLAWAWSAWPETRLSWLGWLLYRSTLATCGLAFVVLVWRFRRRQTPFAAWWRRHAPGIAVAVVATVVVFACMPPEMRVQFDETSLVGTSQNMHLQRTAVMTTAALPYGGAPVPVENMVDKRPTLFAFGVSLLHDVSGYRVANAFVANGALLALGLTLVFVLVRARRGALAAVAAQLLVVSVPLVAVTATSAGFELLATVALLAASMAALAFVERPDDVRAATFAACCLLLAYCRYESLLAVALLAGMAATMAARRGYRPGRRVLLLLLAIPTLLAPLLLLLVHAQSPNFTPEAGGQAKVSWQHLFDHLPRLLGAWFSPAANVMPGLLAMLAGAVCVHRVVRRRPTRTDALLALPALCLTGIVLCWFYGDVREPTAWRLFLPLAWLTALAPAALPAGHGRWLLAGAVVMVPANWLLLADGAAFPRPRIAAMTHALDGVVDRLATSAATTLWVGAPAQHLIVHGHAAVSVEAFARHRSGIASLRRQRDITDVYLVETPIDADMAPAFGAPRELLRRVPGRVVERIGGEMPITVHLLSP